MKIIENPSKELVERLVAKRVGVNALSSDRYAQSPGTDCSLYIQTPEGLFRVGAALVAVTCYITVYGRNEESVTVSHVAHVNDGFDHPLAGKQFPMYDKRSIDQALLHPITEDELPVYYKVVRTQVCYKDLDA